MENRNVTGRKLDLVYILKLISVNKNLIFKTGVFFFVFGLIVAIFSRDEFSTKSTFIVQSNEMDLKGSVGSLAAIAGLNVGGSSSKTDISPNLYDKIVTSNSFIQDLSQELFFDSKQNKKMSLNEFYDIEEKGFRALLKNYTIGLPRTVIGLFKSSNSIDSSLQSTLNTISYQEYLRINDVKSRISLNIDAIDGFIDLGFTFPDAYFSAEVSVFLRHQLEEYLLVQKTKKLNFELNSLNKMLEVQKNDLEIIENKLADFKDTNFDLKSSMANYKLSSLESEYALEFDLFDGLRKEIESKKIALIENKPAFLVIRPVEVPIKKSNLSRSNIVILFTFLGVLMSILFVVLQPLYRSFQREFS